MSNSVNERIVYHYTNQNGFLGILNSKSIWASHMLYQNDSKEFTHGREMFFEYIREFFPSRFSNYSDNIIKEISEWIELFNNPFFTISFSEERASLNQYRSYAKSKSGFSIGFNIDRILNSFNGSAFQTKFVRCVYTYAEQKELIQKVVDRSIMEMGVGNELTEDFIPFIAARIVSNSPIIKHESFSEEREWRLIFDYLNPIRECYNFRTGDSFIIPYLAIPIVPKDVIHEVIIGPTPYSELAIVATKELASKYALFEGCLDARVHYSGLPYRNW